MPIRKRMSLGTKPLIFVEPLSQTLQKLREVISENAESEGIEVFDVEELAELGQLIPTIGQGLVLTSSPKKCALYLQANRRVVKKIGTKTILLSPKSIPRKTLDKFMKVGLTECVVEPVNPKTLLYKVRLQLRSIVATSDEEEDTATTFKRDEGEANVDNNAKMRAEKGVIMDDEEAPEVQKKKKKDIVETVMEDPRKANRKKYQEEAIDGYYKGKKKKEEVADYDEEGKKKRKVYQEEVIESHYKGKLDVPEVEIEEEPKKKKKAPLMMEEYDDEIKAPKVELDLEEDFIKKAKAEINDEMNDDINQRKKALDIEIDDDTPKDREVDKAEDLGGHYKGKLKQNQLDLEDDEYLDEKEEVDYEEGGPEKKKKPKLEIVEDTPDYHDKKEEEQLLESEEKKKKAKLDVVDDEEKDYIDRPEEELETQEKEKKAKLDLVDDSPKDKERTQAKIEEIEKEDKKKDAKAEHLDGYLRGGAAKKNLDVEDDEDLYRDEAKEEEYAEKKKKKEALLLEDDIEKDPLLDEKEYDDDYTQKKKAEKLLVEDDDGFGKREKMLAEDDSELGRRKSNYKEDDKGGFSKGKGGAKKEEERGPGNRADARADHIKTHYSSKESLKHGDQDWDSKWDKKKPEDDFGPMKREDKELLIEKEDLGEQTIDYGQLKKEFEGISIDGISNKKKEYGSFDNVIKPKTYKKRVATVDGSMEEMEFEEVEEENMEVEGEQVFEPESLGMEIAIEVQDFYFEKDMDTEKLCRFLNEKMGKAFRGQLVFYNFAKEELPPPFFNGLVEGKVGEEPEKLPEEELEGYTRLERRELEKDYKEELAAFKSALSEAKESWESDYGNLLEEWRAYKTPEWKDHTFQEESNHFVFPFYEGVTLMGLAVFIPDEDFNPERSDALEAVFEVARGIFITEYHQAKGEGQVRQKKKKKDKPKKEKKGLLGKLFGKAG